MFLINKKLLEDVVTLKIATYDIITLQWLHFTNFWFYN